MLQSKVSLPCCDLFTNLIQNIERFVALHKDHRLRPYPDMGSNDEVSSLSLSFSFSFSLDIYLSHALHSFPIQQKSTLIHHLEGDIDLTRKELRQLVNYPIHFVLVD